MLRKGWKWEEAIGDGNVLYLNYINVNILVATQFCSVLSKMYLIAFCITSYNCIWILNKKLNFKIMKMTITCLCWLYLLIFILKIKKTFKNINSLKIMSYQYILIQKAHFEKQLFFSKQRKIKKWQRFAFFRSL